MSCNAEDMLLPRSNFTIYGNSLKAFYIYDFVWYINNNYIYIYVISF